MNKRERDIRERKGRKRKGNGRMRKRHSRDRGKTIIQLKGMRRTQ